MSGDVRGQRDPWVGLSLTLLALPVELWQGYVLAVLWGWFLVPLGVPGIGAVQAAGLVTLVDLLRLRVIDRVSIIDEDYLARWIGTFVFAPAMLLGVGWVFHAVGGGR